jgi:hypothetical protein
MKKITIIAVFIFLISCGKNAEIKTVLTAFTGPVKINSTSVSDTGITIKPGDIIETGEKSFCDIMINEKNLLRVSENSRVVFHVTAKDCFINIEKGWLAGITRAKFTDEGRYKINTPTVAAAVRGTSFCVKVEDEKNTYFCVCNGTINLAEAGEESGEDVTASHHAAKRFTQEPDGSIKTDSNPGLLYHTDKGVEEMAAVINEKIDWSRPD